MAGGAGSANGSSGTAPTGGAGSAGSTGEVLEGVATRVLARVRGPHLGHTGDVDTAHGPARPASRRLLGLDPDSNLVSLLWAAPFMVFLGFPIAASIDLGVTSNLGAPILVITLAFAVVYVLTWVLNPPAPRSGSLSVRLLACIAGQVLLQVALIWASLRAGMGGTAYLLSYLAASWTLLSPRRLVVAGNVAILGFGVSIAVVLSSPWTDLFLGLGSPLMTATVCFIARSSIDFDRRTSVEHRQAVALSRERERTRISADLHDILGHTLTGITVKADLAGRLLDAGRTEDARAQLDDLTDLAREALGDVRSVVSAQRLLTPAAEIESARALLDSAGVTLEVDHRGDPTPGEPATLAAHVIREACTNALLHAQPSVVRVRLDAGGVEVRSDGYSRRLSHSTAGGGTGLEGLRARLGAGDRLEWGPHAGEWVVTLELGR